MTHAEAKKQEERLAKFRELDARRREINEALHKLTRPWPAGPCEQGPFTGNTRESRQIASLQINFTRTRGGASEVSERLDNLLVEACEFGGMLQAMLRKQLAALDAEIDKL